MTVLSFAAFKAAQHKSDDFWCGPCSDAADVKQYLTPHIHRLGGGKSETRWSCPGCGEEFV